MLMNERLTSLEQQFMERMRKRTGSAHPFVTPKNDDAKLSRGSIHHAATGEAAAWTVPFLTLAILSLVWALCFFFFGWREMKRLANSAVPIVPLQWRRTRRRERFLH